MRPSCFAEERDKLLVNFGELIAVSVDQNVLVTSLRADASPLDQAVALQNFLGNGGNPHIGLRISVYQTFV